MVARRVLFCGDPASLPPEVAARCAVITMAPVAASDLTVLVDRRAATLHPMGLVVRPHLQSTETAEQIAELVAPHPEGDRTARAATTRHGNGRAGSRDGRAGARSCRRAAPDDDAPSGRVTGRTPAQSRPPGGRARRLSRAAPARRHHQRPAAHPRARVVRRRRRIEDSLQHGLCGAAGHGRRRARRSALSRRHASWSLPTLAPGHDRRAACRGTRRRGEGSNPIRLRPSPTSAPRSPWWRASRWPTHCRGTRGGKPRATADASPRCSSTPPASWPRWPPMPGSSISPGGDWSKHVSSSPTARRSPGPPWRSPRRKATRTASASSGASASAGWTPSTREAPRRRVPESLYGELSRRVLVGVALPDGAPARPVTATSG